MYLRLYKPRPELRHLVSRIMITSYELEKGCPLPTTPFPPHPEQCLYFYPGDKITCRNYSNGQTFELPRSILVGPQLSRIDLTLCRRMLVVMVGFQPGGLHRLLHLPMKEMLNHPVESSLLLGPEIDNVTEQLAEAADPDRMANIVENFLLKKSGGLKQMLPLEEVLIQMLYQKKLVNVDQLARHACVSVRQLERQFQERTGMPPKVFSRLVRFSNAWVMREKHPALTWTKIAHACDYADQMHMIRDFKTFAGVTPRLLEKDLDKSTFRLQGTSFD